MRALAGSDGCFLATQTATTSNRDNVPTMDRALIVPSPTSIPNAPEISASTPQIEDSTSARLDADSRWKLHVSASTHR